MIGTRLMNSLFAAAALGVAGLSSGCLLMHARGGGCMGDHGDGHGSASTEAVCPACGAKVKVDERTPRATHRGKLLYFASEEHLREFLKDSSRYPVRQPEGSPEGGHAGHGGAP